MGRGDEKIDVDILSVLAELEADDLSDFDVPAIDRGADVRGEGGGRARVLERSSNF